MLYHKKARRFAAASAMAFTLLGLAACRQNPDVAAYVGNTEYKESRVTELTEGMKPLDASVSRQQVVTYLVLQDVCSRLAKDKGFSYTKPEPRTGLTDAGGKEVPTPEFVAIFDDANACFGAIPATPVPATDADLHEIYDEAKGVVPASDLPTFAEMKQQIDQWGGLPDALGQRKALMDAADKAGVTVNPRYRPLYLGVVQFSQHPVLKAFFGESSSVVSNRS